LPRLRRPSKAQARGPVVRSRDPVIAALGRRGRAALGYALSAAAVLIVFSGCKRAAVPKATAAAAPLVGYVRLAELERYHPLYGELSRLVSQREALAEGTTVGPPASLRAEIPGGAAEESALSVLPPSGLSEQAQGWKARMMEAEARTVKDYATDPRREVRGRLRRGLRQAEREMRLERAAASAELAQKQAESIRQRQRNLEQLELQGIGADTGLEQALTVSGQQVRRELDSEFAQQRAKVEESLAQARRERQAWMDARLKTAAESLKKTEREQAEARAMAAETIRREQEPRLAQTTPPAPVVSGAVPSSEVTASRLRSAAQETAQATAARRASGQKLAAELDQKRLKLAGRIERDTRLLVERLAREEDVMIQAEPGGGAPDMTPHFAELVRAHWGRTTP